MVNSSPGTEKTEVIYADIITIPIFTKLLAIRKVASNRLGNLSRSATKFSVFDSDAVKRSRCSFFKEKKATSEPDIIAEQNNKIRTPIKLTTKLKTDSGGTENRKIIS